SSPEAALRTISAAIDWSRSPSSSDALRTAAVKSLRLLVAVALPASNPCDTADLAPSTTPDACWVTAPLTSFAISRADSASRLSMSRVLLALVSELRVCDGEEEY